MILIELNVYMVFPKVGSVFAIPIFLLLFLESTKVQKCYDVLFFYAFLLPNRLKICPCLNKQPGTRDNCRKSTVKNYHNLGGFWRNNRTISFYYGKRWHIIDIYFKGEFQNNNVDYISNVIHSVMGLLALITQKKCNSEFKF